MKKAALLLILLFALGIRVYSINSPPVGVHQWRQTQTAMIAENYYENGYRFFYPQINWAGGTEGYAETDFPVYSFVVAVGYHFFGDHDWVGRVFSVFFSLATIVFLYLLVRKHIDERTALWSSFFFAVMPLVAFYGRAIMPETMMLMSTAGGIYFFSEWLTKKKFAFLALSFVFIANACLLKPTSFYVGLPLLYLALESEGAGALRRLAIWAYAVLVVAVVFAWYYHAHNILLETGQTIGLYDKFANWGLLLKAKFWNRIIMQSLMERHFAWTGFPVFIIGLFLKREKKGERLFDFWLLAVAVYMLIAGQGNFVHDYYQLVFMLPGVVFAGKVFARHFDVNRVGKDKKSALLALALIGVVVFSFIRLHKWRENTDESATYNISRVVREKTAARDLIVTVTDGDPAVLYFSHRKGWVLPTSLVEEERLDGLVKEGAVYLVGLYWRFDRPDELDKLNRLFNSGKYKVVYDDKSAFIVRLKE